MNKRVVILWLCFFLLIRGDLQSKDIVPLMQRTFQFIADFEGKVRSLGYPIFLMGIEVLYT